jgi:hypothetical protein
LVGERQREERKNYVNGILLLNRKKEVRVSLLEGLVLKHERSYIK